MSPETTIAVALRCIAQALEAAGIEEPRREARWLLAEALGLDLSDLIAREARPLGASAGRVAEFLARRVAREPLSRILGRRDFHGLDLALGPETLDPRPDTETLVEGVLAALRAEARSEAPLSILDLGTGSGAILLALLAKLPAARGTGIDIAAGAVAVARGNAESLGLAGRAAFFEADLFAGLAGEVFDIIVSNPPYIPSGEIATLDPEVRLHDPHPALDGGADGLAFYRLIAREAGARLAPGGLLGLEIGATQAEDVMAILRACGFSNPWLILDLAGRPRVVLARPGEGG